MSNDALSWAWGISGVSSTEKVVLLALADRANREGRCWPSLADIARRCCLAERSVRRALRALEQRGLVTSRQRTADSRVSTSSEYFLPALLPGQTVLLGGHSVRLPGPTVRGRGTDRPGEGDPQSPKPKVEPSREPRDSSSPSATASEPAGFAEFWMAYPKKVGKGAARKAWKRLKVNGHLPAILAAVERQKASDQWKREGGRFIPHPATWLNQGRWEDEDSDAGPHFQDHRERLN